MNQKIESMNIISVQKLEFPWQTQDPFLFCAYHKDKYPKGNGKLGPAASLSGHRLGQDFGPQLDWRMYHGQEIPGFPYHPHRGFETVSIAKQGVIDHADSLGGAGRFSNGDVQWMTAGKGIQHSEMFPLVHEDRVNPLEMFQIWLNLPEKDKMVEPHFAMLWSEDIPHITEIDDKGKKAEIDVIAGPYKETKSPKPAPNSWANNPSNEVAIWTVKLEAGATWHIPAARQDIGRSIYFYDGETMSIDGQEFLNGQVIDVKSTVELPIVAREKDIYLLILQGKAINEPIAKHGPFVMNTTQEIQAAFLEYQETQFGGWPWDKKETHHENSGRFALYSDGTRVEKGEQS